MRIVIHEVTHLEQDRGIQQRMVAQWVLPNTTEPMEVSFTQLATPDSTKVCTYRMKIYR